LEQAVAELLEIERVVAEKKFEKSIAVVVTAER
jgi:hypothetical protein